MTAGSTLFEITDDGDVDILLRLRLLVYYGRTSEGREPSVTSSAFTRWIHMNRESITTVITRQDGGLCAVCDSRATRAIVGRMNG